MLSFFFCHSGFGVPTAHLNEVWFQTGKALENTALGRDFFDDYERFSIS